MKKIGIDFDSDFDHPMETIVMTHLKTAMPFCVQDFIICDDAKKQVYKTTGNH
jgi:hypothetical protein